MIARLTLATLVLAIGSSAFAGTVDGYLDCKSSSGRTTVSGVYPIDSAENEITITVDGKSRSYSEGMVTQFGDTVSMVKRNLKNDFELGAYDMTGKFDLRLATVESKGSIVTIPSRSSTKVKFNATVNGIDPRTNGYQDLPAISVKCIFEIPNV